MSTGFKVTILRLTPLYGILAFLVSFPLQNYRVESLQPNGLPMITYPLWGLAIILQLVGFGLVVFGILFIFAPLASMGFRSAAVSSALVGIGVPLIALSVYGALGNYSEWGVHFCTNPQPYPVCNSILWLIADFVSIGLVGALLLIAGFYVRLHKKSNPVINP